MNQTRVCIARSTTQIKAIEKKHLCNSLRKIRVQFVILAVVLLLLLRLLQPLRVRAPEVAVAAVHDEGVAVEVAGPGRAEGLAGHGAEHPAVADDL